MKKVISSPEGFRVKEIDSKGNSKGCSAEAFATEEEAKAFMGGKKAKPVNAEQLEEKAVAEEHAKKVAEKAAKKAEAKVKAGAKKGK